MGIKTFSQRPYSPDFALCDFSAPCLPSRKLSKLDEPDMQDTAGEAGTSS